MRDTPVKGQIALWKKLTASNVAFLSLGFIMKWLIYIDEPIFDRVVKIETHTYYNP